MFATLRYSPEEGTISVQRTHGPMEGTGHHRSSCDSCRIKKLRCSSEKDGCERCRARRIRCVYTTAIEKKKQNRRSRRASETSSSSLENSYSEGNSMSRTNSDLFREMNGRQNIPEYHTTDTRTSIAPTDSNYSVDKLVMEFGPRGSLNPSGIDNHYRQREGSMDSLSMGTNGYLDISNFLPFTSDGSSVSTYPVSDFSSSPDVLTTQPYLPPGSVAHWDSTAAMDMSGGHHPMSNMDMAPPASAPHQYNAVQCQCLNQGIQILGDLESHIQQNTLTSIDLTLSMQKRALMHSARMVDCKLCSSMSACKTTLILLCEKLVVLFQSVAATCLEQRKFLRRQQQLGENVDTGSMNFDTGQKMRLGEYELDSTHELGFVGSMLVLLQGQRLLGMVARLKSFAVTAGSEAQLSRLVDSEMRVAKTMKDLKKASSDPVTKP